MNTLASRIPGVLGIHHVAIAVRDINTALAFWCMAFGASVDLREAVVDQGVEAASLTWGEGSCLELISPLTPESSVARFLDKRGDSMHHIAWSVSDVAACIASLRSAGLRMIDDVPRTGLHGTPVAFVHPSAAGGILVELVEVP